MNPDDPTPGRSTAATEITAVAAGGSLVSHFRLPAILALLLALGVGGGVYLIDGATAAETGSTATPPPAPRVTVAPVEQRIVTDHRELLGRVDATETVEVRPRVSGYIDEVRLRAGELVNKGDVLFVIDPRQYRAQVNQATAGVERARVRLSIAAREARRSDALLKTRAISEEEADTRSTRFAEVRAELLSAEATLATAQLDLEHTEVRAPVGGRVNRAYVTAGNLVSGSPAGATLLTSIVSVGEVYVYADADEDTVLAFNRLRAAGRIATDKDGRVPVEMQLSDEENFPHRGVIESTDNRIDPATGSLVVRMAFPNTDGRLVPGLFARVRLPVSSPEPSLLVSERAIGTDQNQKFVFTVGADNTVAYRTVRIGPALDSQRVVRDGLKPGERVIVNGLHRVRPGMTVTPELASNDTATTPAATVALR
ncbi:efflux RND transporter periplasmic adaptor subunit [Termitidicoccus mucosus]|uniref:Efflux transporter periplasmic adaptor subunit n=1 Tax=Termitidicoccus mucosus TaxID=1184151 RepID=A0A178INI2_9BACT|nr:efflux transporter periplasmic adaptor subunit [Opitutaceae bacterium TSB47]